MQVAFPQHPRHVRQMPHGRRTPHGEFFRYEPRMWPLVSERGRRGERSWFDGFPWRGGVLRRGDLGRSDLCGGNGVMTLRTQPAARRLVLGGYANG
jgi:hypothetical protein